MITYQKANDIAARYGVPCDALIYSCIEDVLNFIDHVECQRKLSNRVAVAVRKTVIEEFAGKYIPIEAVIIAFDHHPRIKFEYENYVVMVNMPTRTFLNKW